MTRYPRGGKHAALALAASALLCACPSAVRPPAVDEGVAPLLGGERYVILADESLLQVLVRRGGRLASLGHNHVVASRNLNGSVVLRDAPAEPAFELRIPVELLTVDEPGLRAGLGAEFERDVPEDARVGTRRNMLSDAVLDGERHPAVVVRSESLRGGPAVYEATVSITVRGQTHAFDLPLQVERGGDRLRVSGRARLSQSALGLTPFSVMLGALTVQDALDVEFRIIARRAPS